MRMSTVAPMLSVIVRAFHAALASAVAAPAPVTNEIPNLDPFFGLSGALLKDGFDGPQQDATPWARPRWWVDNHKAIGVKIEIGHLVISAPSHPQQQRPVNRRVTSDG